jgi:hypothetical protein
MLENIKEERNPMVIRSLIRNNYFCKYYEKTQKCLKNIPQFL